jgi:hypothetical protein
LRKKASRSVSAIPGSPAVRGIMVHMANLMSQITVVPSMLDGFGASKPTRPARWACRIRYELQKYLYN